MLLQPHSELVTREVIGHSEAEGYVLQEGFGLSSSTVLHGRSTVHDVVSPKASGRGQVVCLNRQNSMGPATDSLDHRAGACYLLCDLLYNELHCAIGVQSLSVPPSAF